jgi:beta-glucosidase-like glycosyl hydrolase/CubicO group peptidase (beta-lactamase class C family)
MSVAKVFVAVITAFIISFTPFRSDAQASRQQWVNNIYNSLTLEEKIGQLFMVAAYSGGKDYNEDKITELLNNHMLGGVIFMQGTPEAQAYQTNKYQKMANVPLLIGMDAEWGLGMRLTGVKDFPRQMFLGATRDTNLVYEMGVAVAKQCKRLGVHIDFAPVVDVNNNPDNPIINFRSFGEDKVRVSQMGIAYMKGLQANGIIACGKHFPGHGDTKTDSHSDMPVINKSLEQLEQLELYPFRQLINAGIKSMMIAHLNVPALEKGNHVPTTLSKNTITNYLRGKLDFNGLVFTDALNMQGITKYYEPGEVDLLAFKAGNDVLLFSQNVPTAIAKIKAAIESGEISEADLERSVKKILSAKYNAGLANFEPIDARNITNDLNKDIEPIRKKIANAGITVVKDDNAILEKLRENMSVGYIGVNTSSSLLQEILADSIGRVEAKWLPHGASEAQYSAANEHLDYYDAVVVAIHNLTFYPSGGDYGLDRKQLDFISQAASKKNVIIVLMGNPYLLRNMCDVKSALIAYEDDDITQTVTARILLRKKRATGKMPVTPCPDMKATVRETVLAQANEKPKPPATKPANKLESKEFVQDAGVVNPDALDKLNLFIQRSIADRAFPGCRIIAAKDGNIFYDESFGYLDYDKKKKVDKNTMYDIASMTKILSTNLAVMRLYETGKLDLNKTVGQYLDWTRGTDKANLRIKDMLLHQAGLKSWIPFYKETLESNSLYKETKGSEHTVEVARNMYLQKDYPAKIWETILASPLENKGKYVYSDLDFYFLAAIAEKITGKKIDQYCDEQFYKPMGLTSITYRPLTKFSIDNIAPTEDDKLFRQQVIRGYVHDQGAALLGGVAGHAGLFSNAGDVAAIFQMLLNNGTYEGTRYFKESTVKLFTSYNSSISRRGYGFDKSQNNKDDGGPTGNRASGYTFGHQGFTGTCGWADPGNGVVFIFLSNRVYPSADNGAINKLSVRTVAQDYIYEALGIPVDHNRQKLHLVQTGGKQTAERKPATRQPAKKKKK